MYYIWGDISVLQYLDEGGDGGDQVKDWRQANNACKVCSIYACKVCSIHAENFNVRLRWIRHCVIWVFGSTLWKKHRHLRTYVQSIFIFYIFLSMLRVNRPQVLEVRSTWAPIAGVGKQALMQALPRRPTCTWRWLTHRCDGVWPKIGRLGRNILQIPQLIAGLPLTKENGCSPKALVSFRFTACGLNEEYSLVQCSMDS
jgi:hypothetical protein